MKPLSREDFAKVISAAVIRPRLRRSLRFVPEEIVNWENKDFLVVTTKGGTEGVIIPASLSHAIPFRLQSRTPNANGRIEAIICDLCATWQRGTHSAILTLERERKSVSYLVDLRCSQHVRDQTSESRLSRAQVREHMNIDDRIRRLRNKLDQIIDDYSQLEPAA